MNWFQELAVTYGPVGVFTVSLLGSLVPFLPVPYLFVVVLLSETVDPLVLGLASGLGGSFGKITSYLLGRLGYRFLGQEGKNRMDALRELIGRYGDIGVFVFALTPLPDDVYLIPAGMVKLNFWRFLLANTLGKLILSTAVAYMGKTYFYYSQLFLGEATLVSTAVAIVAMTIITILLLKVNWELALKIIRESGWKGIIRNLSSLFT
ncbi:MAG: VTT domain-containing protein [Candidatus Caldarchaeum sp.]|uniref:DedA family protein n=1 Tax=Caldiarchaeum subterraneum TaxID=311458 RepID=A0A7C5LDT0_CALS0